MGAGRNRTRKMDSPIAYSGDAFELFGFIEQQLVDADAADDVVAATVCSEGRAVDVGDASARGALVMDYRSGAAGKDRCASRGAGQEELIGLNVGETCCAHCAE